MTIASGTAFQVGITVPSIEKAISGRRGSFVSIVARCRKGPPSPLPVHSIRTIISSPGAIRSTVLLLALPLEVTHGACATRCPFRDEERGGPSVTNEETRGFLSHRGSPDRNCEWSLEFLLLGRGPDVSLDDVVNEPFRSGVVVAREERRTRASQATEECGNCGNNERVGESNFHLDHLG